MLEPLTLWRSFSYDGFSLLGACSATVLGLAAVIYYMTSRQKRLVPPVDLKQQSIELEDGSRICAYKGTGGELLECLYDDVRTLYDAFQRGMKQSNNGPCLAARTGPNQEYEWLTYKQVYNRAHAFGSGLLRKAVDPGTETMIGIYSRNKMEWTITEQACNMFSMVTVALYDTLGPEACKFIINQTQLSTVICEDAAKTQLLLDQADQLPSLKFIVVIGQISAQNRVIADKHGIELTTFQEVEEDGSETLSAPQLPQPSDLCTVCYTSGTTGNPKGVMLSHANFISSTTAVLFQVQKNVPVCSKDVHLSYLPLAHVLERCLQILVFTEGGRIGFYSGDVKLLLDDIQALKPTIFITVPRLLNRLHGRIMDSVQGSAFKRRLLALAIKKKMAEVKKGIFRRNSIWDKLVFNKVQNALGGNLRILVTGSAPISMQVMDFLRASFGCPVLEGYGQTESSAVICFNVPGETISGNCGPPLACNRVKLFDVPEMEYFSADRRGEVCIKGPCVFVGYYKDPEKTAEAIDNDGWLHTGDIGEWTQEGTLRIIDRKKNIFKLSQGEYIACEKIENIYLRSKCLAQCFVDGRSLGSYIMAVVTLEEEYMVNWTKEKKINKTVAELATDQEVKKAVLANMLSVGREAGLKGFEQVKDIYIYPDLFSIENGLLTPSMKSKRVQLRKKFEEEINELYRLHE